MAHRILLAATLAAAFLGASGAARATDRGAFDVLQAVRANHRTALVTFRVPGSRTHASALRVRSGSLPMTIVGIEIEYADGDVHRITARETVPPGHVSRPVSVDGRRAMATVLVMLQPSPRAGETTIQLLGKIAENAADPAPLPSRR